MYCDNKLISVTVTYVNIYRPICAWWRPWFLCIRVEGAQRTLTLKICALGVRAIARARPRRGLGTIYTPTKLGGVNHPRQWRQWAPGPISLEYLSAISKKATIPKKHPEKITNREMHEKRSTWVTTGMNTRPREAVNHVLSPLCHFFYLVRIISFFNFVWSLGER